MKMTSPIDSSLLTWSEIQGLLLHINKAAHVKGNEQSYRLLMYAAIIVNCGLLPNEILNMKWRDIMFNPKCIIVGEGNRKKSVKVAPALRGIITKACGLAFTDLFLEDRAVMKLKLAMDLHVFSNLKSEGSKPISIQYMNRWLQETCFAYGFHKHRVTAHYLRKVYARHKYESSSDPASTLIQLSKELRHSSSSVTKRYIGL